MKRRETIAVHFLGPIAVQQRRDNLIPFRGQLMRRGLTMRLAIPITGVVQIALDAVEISVHPGAIAAVLVHDDPMRFIPVVPGRHHSARNAAQTPAGGAFSASEPLKLSGVMSLFLNEGATSQLTNHLPPPIRRNRSGSSFDHGAECEQCLFGERLADELQPQRQSLTVETRRN